MQRQNDRITIKPNYFGKWQPQSLRGILQRMSPRTEKREFIALSVRVSGTDASGKNFRQPVCTLDLSSKGARITGLSGVNVGQILTLEYQNNKVRYEVVWVGEQGTPKAGQVGLRRVDNDKVLAEVQFTADYVDTWKGRS
jgi:PilZ domain-containing protein